MHGAPPPGEAFEVFYSYAREDEALKEKLSAHLAALYRQGFIVEWHDRLIPPGAEFHPEILKHLESSRVILLLVSPDFIKSKYIYDVELRRAVERHLAGEAVVIPVVLRPCDWQDVPVRDAEGRVLLRLGDLQALPKGGHPVTLWDDADSALYDVEQGVKRAVLKLIPRVFPDDEPVEEPPPAPPYETEEVFEVRVGVKEAPRPSLLKAILAHLRAVARDVHLALLEEREGSLILLLRGQRRGFSRLLELYLSHELTHLFGFELERVRHVRTVEKSSGGAPGVTVFEEGEEGEKEYDPQAISFAAFDAERAGDPDAARRILRRGVQTALARGDDFGYAALSNDLGVVEKHARNFGLARGHFRTALAEFVRLKDEAAAALVRGNLKELDELEKQ